MDLAGNFGLQLGLFYKNWGRNIFELGLQLACKGRGNIFELGLQLACKGRGNFFELLKI
jgi:hypothetical protein